jgi:cytochrome c-type biogenesis protein CcmH
MILFWIIAAVLTAGAGALILAGAAWARAAAQGPDPSVATYRRALAEIDALDARQLLPPAEAPALRAEAARRLLSAADAARPAPVTPGGPAPLLAAAVVTALSALGIYLLVGAPGAPDQPFAARVAEWRAHPEHAQTPELAAALRSAAAERPGDIEPLRRLAALDVQLGDIDAAAHDLRKALALAPGDADLIGALGELAVVKAGGKVTPDAQALFGRALAIDPASPTARYYLARARIADGDAAGGLAQWRDLLKSLPPGDGRTTALAEEIDQVRRAGVLAPPESATPADPEGGMILGMVERLAGRLKASPDDPDGWVRLVRAYAVLGETAKRDQAALEARRRFAARPQVLKALDAAERAPPMARTP